MTSFLPSGRRPSATSELENLSAHDDRGHTAVANLSLHVRAGEIVGIAGVSGNGQRELIEVLSGQRELNAGRMLIDGKAYHATRKEMRRHKVFCLPEEPLKNASVGRMSVAENLAFRQFDVPPFVAAGQIINRLAIRKAAQNLVERFAIRTASVDTPVEVLSGGNIQRMVLARELSHDVQVLIAAIHALVWTSKPSLRYVTALWKPGTAVLRCCW